ncbi:hypothetical protein FGO68_gene13631 [Halteria grandinella]|uniref:Uncharacterized protein n=1 Tax=Halteria grandinella TaxID=5974 RepID=A0A8J8N9G9_HALGN|nr:hypothetical protein FGO68_gene13631 [Halteria grandinella]
MKKLRYIYSCLACQDNRKRYQYRTSNQIKLNQRITSRVLIVSNDCSECLKSVIKCNFNYYNKTYQSDQQFLFRYISDGLINDEPEGPPWSPHRSGCSPPHSERPYRQLPARQGIPKKIPPCGHASTACLQRGYGQ